MQVTKLSYLYNEHENTAGEIPAFTPHNFLVKKVYQLAQLVCQPIRYSLLPWLQGQRSRHSPCPSLPLHMIWLSQEVSPLRGCGLRSVGGGRHESTGCGLTTGICLGRQHGLSRGSLQRVIKQCWWEGPPQGRYQAVWE